MFKSFTTLFLSAGLSILSIAQTGKISGKIIDASSGEALIGATVLLEGTSKGAAADIEGNFSINTIPVGSYNLVVSYITYETKKINSVLVKNNEVTQLDLTLSVSSAATTSIVEISAEMNKENTSTLVIMQKNNASVSDGISSESIKKTPDRNTSDVLKRISGASIQDDKFVVIRGLNDRYNAAYLNGAALPSSESDRKAFAFNVFPSSLLDNLTINKTATPDMPAEFAGGIILINTKSIPEKNFQSVTIGGGYNSLTTGKEQFYSKGGKYDWIGMDDGNRALPDAIPTKKDFSVLRSDQAEYAKQMKNDWTLGKNNFAPNSNFQYAMGYTVKRKEKDFLGVIASLTYNKTFNYSESIIKSYTSSSEETAVSQQERDFLTKTYSNQTLAAALANFNCKLNDHNTIAFKNLYSINSENKVLKTSGTKDVMEANPNMEDRTVQGFQSNNVYTGQLSGDHFIPKAKTKINWLGSYSSIARNQPNLRSMVYGYHKDFIDPQNPDPKDTMHLSNVSNSSIGVDYSGFRFYSQLNEKIYSFKSDVSRQFNLNTHNKMDIKVGGYYQQRSREFTSRSLGYIKYGAVGGDVAFKDSLLTLAPNQIFANQNMGLLYQGAGGFALTDATKYTDSYLASSKLTAGYLMFDNRYKESLRLIWGVRAENYNQVLQTNLDKNKQLKLDTTQLDILPSGNLVISLTPKQNVRVCYSQTINRPEFRELAPFSFFDFETQFVTSGNPNLKRAKIHNYDLRYEYYPGKGQLITATGFYKDFINPIEQVMRNDVSNEISYSNAKRAKNYGVELEFRVLLGSLFKRDSCKLLNNLTLYSNVAYIKSSVDVSGISATYSSRPMQGQSPYVFNAGLLYNNSDLGLSLSAAVNRIGNRIAIVGSYIEPDIWEQGRTVLDFQVGKTFMKNKNLELKLNFRDGLAQNQYLFQDRNNNQKLDLKTDDVIRVRKYGSTLSVSVSYKF